MIYADLKSKHFFESFKTIKISLSSPNDSMWDPWLKIWIPDYTLGNDNFFYCPELIT